MQGKKRKSDFAGRFFLFLCESVIRVKVKKEATHLDHFLFPCIRQSRRIFYSPFLLASYVSTVLVCMTTLVSPFCHASLRVVTVRVTLQLCNPNAIATQVSNAVTAVATIL